MFDHLVLNRDKDDYQNYSFCGDADFHADNELLELLNARPFIQSPTLPVISMRSTWLCLGMWPFSGLYPLALLQALSAAHVHPNIPSATFIQTVPQVDSRGHGHAPSRPSQGRAAQSKAGDVHLRPSTAATAASRPTKSSQTKQLVAAIKQYEQQDKAQAQCIKGLQNAIAVLQKQNKLLAKSNTGDTCKQGAVADAEDLTVCVSPALAALIARPSTAAAGLCGLDSGLSKDPSLTGARTREMQLVQALKDMQAKLQVTVTESCLSVDVDRVTALAFVFQMTGLVMGAALAR